MANNPSYLLALDCGTQSVRALLFDREGQLLAKRQQAFQPPFYQGPGGSAELEAQHFWQALCQASKGLLRETGIDPKAIAGAALTTQRGTLLHLDGEGQPLRPAIIWPDRRRASQLPAIPWHWRLALMAAGQLGTVRHFQAEAEINWVAQHEPRVHAEAKKVGLLSAWLTLKLTGQYRDSVASQVGFLPFSYRRQAWAEPWDWKWQALKVRRDQLPELVAPCQLLGELSLDAAEATGLPAGLKLFAAGGDKQAEVLGAGVAGEELASISLGTTATITGLSHKYKEAVRFLPPYPALVPGAYCLEVQLNRGFWLLRWLLQEFGEVETQAAKAEARAAEEIVEELISAVPPGSDGLVFDPHMAPGVIYPGPEARGALVGLTDGHSRAHLYRALIEGIAYALKAGKDRLEKAKGQAFSGIRVSGGGSQSDTVMQILADVLGQPVSRPHTFEASGLGAAMAAAVGLGWYPDMAAAGEAMCHQGQCFWPQPEHQRTYQRLYQEIYKPIYGKLRPLYKRLLNWKD
ncbi:FGGY-family carbohydrate kinase [Gallaecimonas kandeliae]|uniref:FGGY-family carbohydrate kinase n=1 Tax=Gallaecimonas kandeliae TaxID=3029055 RepID=UPI002649D210|nr:FGGY-family carbohydrate kinase [Gallaecimonas kandeliae]WKE66920.1 FGGY-family carbohydrate kinase [Gallaecimonas kandeliae]